MAIDWHELLTVDGLKVSEIFVAHPKTSAEKLDVSCYTLRFSGTQQSDKALMEFLRRQLLKYVFPEGERPEDIDWALARDKFGDVDPESDGKLGELLLYVFVEAFLKTPMMAYKLKDLSNPNDQVKGADGVFVGEYKGKPALLIGESKVYQDLPSAIGRALESLQRFHDKAAPYTNELLIARKYPKERALSGEMLEKIYSIMNLEGDAVLAHPIFIAYDSTEISSISKVAIDAITAEQALAKYIIKELPLINAAVAKHECTYQKPFQVYLDFFFVPVEKSLRLREHFYELLHGAPFKKAAPKKKAAKKKISKKKTAS